VASGSAMLLERAAEVVGSALCVSLKRDGEVGDLAGFI
jgi:hypothetical protein